MAPEGSKTIVELKAVVAKGEGRVLRCSVELLVLAMVKLECLWFW